jgi:hypothetical protein
VDTEDFRSAMRAFRTYSEEKVRPFHATAEYMIGLPGDTYETFLATLADAIRSGAEHVRSFPLLVFPGSELYERSEEYGIEHFDEAGFRVIRTGTFGEREIQRAIHLARFVEVLDTVLPRTFRAVRDAGENPAKLLESFYDAYLALTVDRDADSFENRALVAAVGSVADGGLLEALKADAEAVRIPL